MDKNSHIFKHLKQSKTCSQKYSPNCFKILDTAKYPIFLKLKEASVLHKQLKTRTQCSGRAHDNSIYFLTFSLSG